MEFRKVLIGFFLLSISSVLYAGVGFSSTVFTDNVRDRTLTSYIWYPTNTQGTEIVAENIAFKGFSASKDANIIKKKFPLYILVHGTSGNWKNLSWLAPKLCQGGAIVIAANHPDYTSNNNTPDSVIKMWNQPKDISFLLDSMFESKFGKQLDNENIFVVGYSLGGYSSMAVAGAKLDMKKYLSFCSENKDKSCRYFKSTFQNFNKEFFQNSAQSQKDVRIRASIAIAPGFVESMTNESLNNIGIPTLIIGAELDENVPPNTHFKPKFNAFSKKIKYQEISNATHFSFMQICRPKAKEILAEENAEFVCIDGGKRSRQELHDEIYQMIKNFIRKQNITIKSSVLPNLSRFLQSKNTRQVWQKLM